MEKGQMFYATNKLGEKYLYQFLSEDKEKLGCSYIHLFNRTTDFFTDVEQEWFNQRKIELV